MAVSDMWERDREKKNWIVMINQLFTYEILLLRLNGMQFHENYGYPKSKIKKKEWKRMYFRMMNNWRKK